MNEIPQKLASYIGSLDWSALLQGVGAIWVAVVATIALRTWRQQLNSEKHLSFIDELTDIVHEFILLMSLPTTQLEFAQIEIDAQKGYAFEFEKYANGHAIAYITKSGKDTSARLFASLGEVKPILSKMRALVAKGQVFGFSEYARCQNACQILGWTHDHIETFAAILANQRLNWEHPEVQKRLENLPKFDPVRVRTTLQEQHIEFIEFARLAYKKAIG